jgi:PPM family protein phosphatase
MSTNNGPICPTFSIEHAAISDMGMRRANNQDALAVVVTDDVATWASRGHLLMVADGMGAHAAGELASKMAVDSIPHTYLKRRDLYPPAALRQAIRDANEVIHNKGQSSIGFHGMGTTCSCLVLLPQGALVAHIGDSRVYRLRDSTIEQLTFDHSLVWEMAAAGQMNQDDVPAYIPKNVITRSLGPHAAVHVDVEGPYSADAGDVFLLCSDGLSGPISDEELGAILHCLPPEEAAETLVDLANLRGGPDNISVIVARVNGGELPTIPPATAVGEEQPDRQPAATPQATPIAPLLFAGAAGGCLAVLIYCLVYEMWTGTVIAVGALAAALVSALAFRTTVFAACPSIRPLGGPYGNGPYRKAECPPNGRFVATLDELAGKIRELPEKEPGEWTLDWQSFDDQRTQAATAAENGDYVEAVRRYGQAIRDIMRKLREHRPPIDHNLDSNAI